MSSIEETLSQLRQYFDKTISQHGATAKGVDWKDETSQFIRFDQLLKIVSEPTQPFTLLDFGCGWGALVKYLQARALPVTYIGYDMTESVISEARKTFADLPNVSFTTDLSQIPPQEYVIGSGLFNMKINADEEAWHQHMLQTIHAMWDKATKGLAFNSLTAYSDAEYMRADLYYPSPEAVFGFCKRELSRNVALLHDYNLYDFTLLVRR